MYLVIIIIVVVVVLVVVVVVTLSLLILTGLLLLCTVFYDSYQCSKVVDMTYSASSDVDVSAVTKQRLCCQVFTVLDGQV